MDGNCKNRRDVCEATEAGYVEYPSLPGVIKTGCQLTPMRSGQFCYHHSPRISPSFALPDPETCDENVPLHQSQGKHGVVKFLVAKKTTRSQTYYQVILNHDKMLK